MDDLPRSLLAPSFLPPVAVLEMTFRCNHRCLFCSCPWYDTRPTDSPGLPVRYTTAPELSPARWREVVADLCARGVTTLAFTGGEPLLKEGFLEILEFAAGCSVEHVEAERDGLRVRRGPPRLHLLSNGTAMSEAVLDRCAALGVQLSMSLPGLRTFAWHTGGDPARILGWFEAAKRRGIVCTVAVTVTRRNLPELYETLAAGLLAGADRVLLNRFLPGGRGLLHQHDLSLTPDEVLEALDVAERVLATARRRGSVGTELPRCLLEGRRFEWLEVGSRCSAATHFFVVDPAGRVRACNHSPVALGHVDALDAVRDHPTWRRFVLQDFLPAACRGCVQAGGCDGGCREAAHIVHGHLDAPDACMRPRQPT